MKHLNSYLLVVLALALVACTEAKVNNCVETTNGVYQNQAADAISTGSASWGTCAIYDGKVKCWGENDDQPVLAGLFHPEQYDGELCLNEVDLGTNVTAVSVAVSNNQQYCALTSDGLIKCWGNNSLGELGLGDLIDRILGVDMGDNLPYVDLGAGVTAKSITASDRNFCAITNDDKVKCWGAFTPYSYFASNPGFVGDVAVDMGDNLAYSSLPTNAKKIAMGLGGTCAILDSDSIFCWQKKCVPDSSNFSGPTFTCTDSEATSIPMGVIPMNGITVADIGVGTNFACALLTTGQVRCWGRNDEGQLGLGHTTHYVYSNAQKNQVQNIPLVDLGTGVTATKISVGANHACALLNSGDVKCWGYDPFASVGLSYNHQGDEAGEMGDNLATVELGVGRTAIDISAGLMKTCTLLDNGALKCWYQR